MRIEPSKTLICSAIAEESDRISISGKYPILLCGIGNLEAGLRLQKFLLEHQTKIWLCLLGFCSSVPPEFILGCIRVFGKTDSDFRFKSKTKSWEKSNEGFEYRKSFRIRTNSPILSNLHPRKKS